MADFTDQPSFVGALTQAMGALSNALRFQTQLQDQRVALEQKLALEREQLDLQRKSLELRKQVAEQRAAGRPPTVTEEETLREILSSKQPIGYPDLEGKGLKEITQLHKTQKLEFQKLLGTYEGRLFQEKINQNIPKGGNESLFNMMQEVDRLETARRIRVSQMRELDIPRGITREEARVGGLSPLAPLPQRPSPVPETSRAPMLDAMKSAPTPGQIGALNQTDADLRANILAMQNVPIERDAAARKKLIESVVDHMIGLRKFGSVEFNTRSQDLLAYTYETIADKVLPLEIQEEFEKRLRGGK